MTRKNKLCSVHTYDPDPLTDSKAAGREREYRCWCCMPSRIVLHVDLGVLRLGTDGLSNHMSAKYYDWLIRLFPSSPLVFILFTSFLMNQYLHLSKMDAVSTAIS